jgi:hypothetical protein
MPGARYKIAIDGTGGQHVKLPELLGTKPGADS